MCPKTSANAVVRQQILPVLCSVNFTDRVFYLTAVFSNTGTRSKMKYSVLALVAAATAALPEVAFCAIKISRRFALNHS